jgi:O-Antigen ligase
VLASRPHAKALSRLTACVAAVVLADLAVLCQSRGSLVALSCAIVLYLAVARHRIRAFVHILIAVVATAPAVPTLLHVYSAVIAGHGRETAVEHAAGWIAGSAAVAIAAMLAVLLFERHITLPDRSGVLIGRGLLAVAGAAVVAASVIVAASHPLGHAQRAWHDFTTNKTAPPSTLHFAAGVGTSRYDVWRIAWGQFLAHPVIGVGADNYLVGYYRQRRSAQTSRYPASVELRTFSETGVIGAGLFLGFLAMTFLRAVRAARRGSSPGLALACLVGAGYWLIHSSIDWFWELPALTGAALALLAIASSPVPAEVSRPRRESRSLSLRAIAAATALVVAAVLAIPWASFSLIDAAMARGAGRSSYSLLATAARLNPLSEQPALGEATLAAKAGDRKRERRALLKALRRSPHDWYPYFMLGIVAGREHQPLVARAYLETAHRRSPKDLVIVYAQKRLRWGRPLTERRVAQIFREVTSTLRGVRQK